MTLSDLSRQPVWRHFLMLCEHPRPSGHEQSLRDHLKKWADSVNLAARIDAGGNLIISKPATPGFEDRAGVILQAHLDMVCQKREGSEHDFLRDPVRPVIDNSWVRAEGTTLGADNGIGVAAALALLESTEIAHGPLEVLLTVDEEAGMSGARALEQGQLQGRLLFNLDSEDWGELYVGCAGGMDLTLKRHVARDARPAAFVMRRIGISGLRGGHSGCDIHLERPNAIRLLARLLLDIRRQTDLRLASFCGGSVRNALPREAHAVVAVPACDVSIVDSLAKAGENGFLDEYAGVDQGVRVTVSAESDGDGRVLLPADTLMTLDLLLALPHGVRRWSQAVPGVVETSDNLGVVQLDRDLEIVLMVRSLNEAGMNELAGAIESCARLAGAVAVRSGAYPGWNPDLSSQALQVASEVYRERFGIDPKIRVIHAGLECGLIGAKYPDVAMVSFGPVIRDAHSPDERVEIGSVERFWELLCGCLSAAPRA